MTNIASLRLSGGVFALAVLLPWAGTGVAAESPDIRLQSVSDELLEQIRLRMDEFKRDDEALYSFVEATIGDVLDYEQILKIILGKKIYQETAPAQRDEFILSLKRQLLELYAKVILKYADGEVQYLPFELKPDKAYQVVRTEFLISGKAPVDLTYLMREIEGEWYVFEIRADGIFLIKSLKDSLRPEIKQNGLDAVIQRLRGETSGKTSRRFTPHAYA